MKKTKFAAVFVAMVLCIVPAAFSKEEQPPQISGTYQASCVIKTIDHALPPRMEQNISSVLKSSGIGIRAARDILGYPAETLQGQFMEKMINITFLSGERGTGGDFIYTLELKVVAPDAPKPAAEEFMAALIGGLKQNLDKSFIDYKDRLNQQNKIAEGNAGKAEQDFCSLQERLRKFSELSGFRDLSRKAILADINNLQNQVEMVKMDISNAEGCLVEIPLQVSNIRNRLDEKLKSDTVISEMENIVKAAQNQMSRVKKETEIGRASAADLSEAEEKLARAKIELAQRKEDIQRSSGGSRIDSLNEEYTNYSSIINPKRKRLDYLLQQTGQAKQLLEKADEYEVLLIKADIAKQSLRNALERLDSVKQSADLVPPTVTVMGAD